MSSYIKWGIISAISFCIPMIIFIASADYAATWWLFAGNVLFLVAISLYMITFNKNNGGNVSTQTMVAAGHIATGIGILLSCIVAAITLFVLIPDIFSQGISDKAMEGAPSETGTGKTHGMVFFVFMNAIIGNVSGGSFSSILIPYSAKRNQTKDKKSPVVNN
ncbi:MAG TPA: hypothetical protein VF610_07940 [Segetibacter sp.]